MAFGIYVHIPYCIQRCSYCDFATYEKSSILPPSEYIELVKKEIQVYGPLLKDRVVNTIYFGGGTPSLVEASLLVAILNAIKQEGFIFAKDCEITIEINPATIDEGKLDIYQNEGFNRFSVGAQSFDDRLLKRVGREHDAEDTRKTLNLLAQRQVNFTFDLLFALPSQTLEQLRTDLNWVEHFSPKHLSAYCLTVPDSHPLAKTRLPELDQVAMFEVIEERLAKIGLKRYEISNFAAPGFESRHNMIYWTDQEYWGIGLGAHSYIKEVNWGQRFWNPNNIQVYTQNMNSLPTQRASSIVDYRNGENFENLSENQSMTDYCHTFLRIMKGLNLGDFEIKFGLKRREELDTILKMLAQKGLVEKRGQNFALTNDGLLISNQVFEQCTFLD